MKHLDEGTLQLWLDRSRSGMSAEEAAEIEAHLSSCPSCAERVEALEADTRRAEALLSVPFPDADELPDFAEVRARAEATRRPAGSGRSRRWQPALWAASVVLALGVGWMANEMGQSGLGVPDAQAPAAELRQAPEREAARTAEADQERAAETVATPAESRVEPAPVPDEALVADADLAAPAARPAAPVAEAEEAPAERLAEAEEARERMAEAPAVADAVAADAPAVAADQGADPAAAGARADVFADRDDVAERARADRPAIVRGKVTDEEGRPLESVQVYVADAGVGTLTEADGSFELALERPDSLAGDVALAAQHIGYTMARQTLGLRAGDSASADFRLSQEAVTLDELVVTGEGQATARRSVGSAVAALPIWEPVSLAEAEERVGFRPWTIPNLPIGRVEVMEDGSRVWITQTLQDGATLEMVQAVEGSDAAAELADEQGVTVLVERDGIVVGAATDTSLGREALEALLERLAQGAPPG